MITTYHPNGAVESIAYESGGVRHKYDGPAVQYWNDAGEQICDEWWMYGRLTSKQWIRNGVLHKDNEPADQVWSFNGTLLRESWWQNRQLHRDDGPAVRVWSGNGVLIREEWWQNGYKLTPQEIEKILRPDDIMAEIWRLPQPIAEEISAVYRSV